LNGYQEKSPEPDKKFKIVVSDTLRSKLDEIKTSITFKGIGAGEIDLVLRLGNNIGVAEVKSGNNALGKKGIDQLNTVAAPRFLGTYVAKIWIVDRHFPRDHNNYILAEKHNVKIIELPSFSDSCGNDLSESDKGKLITEVIKILGG